MTGLSPRALSIIAKAANRGRPPSATARQVSLPVRQVGAVANTISARRKSREEASERAAVRRRERAKTAPRPPTPSPEPSILNEGRIRLHVDVDLPTATRLSTSASKRRIATTDLLGDIVNKVVEDDLIGAVLDTGRKR